MKYSIFFLILFLFSCSSLFIKTRQYNVYESKHFTFFYLPNSKIEKNIKEIINYSEIGINFLSYLFEIEIDIKIDTYLYDKGSDTSYYDLNQNMENDSTFEIRNVIQVIFKDCNYSIKETAGVILHEATHYIQQSNFNLKNYAVREGHALYVEYKYLFYINNKDFSNNIINYYLSNSVINGLDTSNDFPNKIFSYTPREFQGINSNEIGRNSGYRYQISASFVSFLMTKYNVTKVKQWFYNLNSENYIKKYKETFNNEFYPDEQEWLNDYVIYYLN